MAYLENTGFCARKPAIYRYQVETWRRSFPGLIDQTLSNVGRDFSLIKVLVHGLSRIDGKSEATGFEACWIGSLKFFIVDLVMMPLSKRLLVGESRTTYLFLWRTSTPSNSKSQELIDNKQKPHDGELE